MNKQFYIYKTINLVDGKQYIGKHIGEINDAYLGSGLNIKAAIKKYGKENFKKEILYIAKNEEDMNEKEKYYIKKYNSLYDANGYNMTFGGKKSGIKFTDLSNKRLGEAIKKAYIENPNAREERRQAALNQWANPEIKKKIMGKNNGMYGRTHTKEAREKISNARKGQPSPTRNTTPVLCIELNKTFSCAAVAAKELNIYPSILEVCKGNRKTCGGYHWEFVKENNI